MDKKPSITAATSLSPQKAGMEDNSQPLSQETVINDSVIDGEMVDEEIEGHETVVTEEVAQSTETQ